MFDEYRQKLSGLLDAMPLVQLLRGEAKVSPEGLQQSLLGMKPFQPPSESEAMNYMNAMTPIGLLGTFAGVGAKTANKALLDAAKKLDASGVDRTKIWNETGWFRGPDKKWRFEIDDSGSRMLMQMGWRPKDVGAKPGTVAGTISHDQLFDAYKSLKKIPYEKRQQVGAVEGDIGGAYFSAPNWRDGEKILVGDQMGGYNAERSIGLHELQHAIQQREGFSRGGNPDDFVLRKRFPDMKMNPEDYFQAEADRLSKLVEPVQEAAMSAYQKGEIDAKEVFRRVQEKSKEVGLQDIYNALRYNRNPHDAYKHVAGEAEARAVQSRMDFTPDKRKAVPPWESYDIPWDQLIVR